MRISSTFIEYLPSAEFISLTTGAISPLPDDSPFHDLHPTSLAEPTPEINSSLVVALRARRAKHLADATAPRTTRVPRSHRPAKPSALESDPLLAGLDPRTKDLLLKALSRKGKP